MMDVSSPSYGTRWNRLPAVHHLWFLGLQLQALMTLWDGTHLVHLAEWSLSLLAWVWLYVNPGGRDFHHQMCLQLKVQSMKGG